MPDSGKIDRAFFADHIAPRLGADREEVALGPTAGVDFGLLDFDGTGLAVATDPISVLPALGFERAGRFALHVALSDVAVAGVLPSHLAISFSLPTSITDEQFDALWTGIHGECEALGTSILTGHTARYPGAEFPWVGAATAMGVCDPEQVVRPDGAQPGDRLLATRGPAVETVGLFASLYPEQLSERGLSAATVADAADGLDEARLVNDAVAAAEAGSAGVRFEVDASAIPVRSGVEAVCDALAVDPWKVTSSGTLVTAVASESVAAVRSAIAERGTPVAEVGTVLEGSGVRFRGEEWTEPPRDPSWDAYADLAE